MSEEYPSLGGSAAETSSNWLTTKNSAARFAYRAFDGDSTSKTTDELIFVDELDAFVPRNKAPDLESCFASSRKEKETFEMMLKDFAQILPVQLLSNEMARETGKLVKTLQESV
ncbi:hypothetical protein CGCF413_v004466 [Colletotrichum fructicola]|nr:hypothetical protein CGCF413_v004466 [Colletotrichum fructicola]